MALTDTYGPETGDPDFTIGDRIRKRRKDLDLDQSDVADAVGVSRPLVSKWERGISLPDVGHAVQLADVLDCSFGWLCGVPLRSRCFSESAQASDDQLSFWSYAERQMHPAA